MQIIPTELNKLSGIAQCLDSEWAPQSVLELAAAERRPVSHYAERIERATKAEFLKSLLMLRSVVVNRSYLVENPTLTKMYLADSGAAATFEVLLEEGAIIPYFTTERSLADDYLLKKLPEGVKKFWKNAEVENLVRRLRFSWDDEINKSMLTNQLGRRFSEFFKSIDNFDIAKLKNDFSLGEFDEALIKKSLIALRNFTNDLSDRDGSLVTRSQIYEKFVCVEGADDFRIDGRKPFALPIKALADLKYNVNLPDALNRYIVTSQGSIGRDSLQEIRLLTEGVETIDGGDLSSFLDNIAKLGLDEATRAVEITDIGGVTLADVRAVRRDPVWELHNVIALENLPDPTKRLETQNFVRNPLKSITDISNSLGNMVTRLSQLNDERRLTEVEQKCEVVVQAIGAFEMVASKAGTHIFGLPEMGPDGVTKRVIERGMVPMFAHLVVSWKGNGIQYEMKQPVFQGKVWAETAQKVARELKRRLTFEDKSSGPSDIQSGGIEVKDRDE